LQAQVHYFAAGLFTVFILAYIIRLAFSLVPVPYQSKVRCVGYYQPHGKSADIIPGVDWQPLLYKWNH